MLRLSSLQLTNFRNYRKGFISFPAGVTVIVGGNGAGKSNLLEAAGYSLCGNSFRTSRDSEMIAAGSRFFRIEAEVENGSLFKRAVSLEEGGSVRVDAGGGQKWLSAGMVLAFSPDDLRLIKGPPARRRRFLDDAISSGSAAYRRTALDYQKTLSQRNSFLQRARSGYVRIEDVTPWDRQLAALALKLHEERRRHCESIAPMFERFIKRITGAAGSGAGERGQEDGPESGHDSTATIDYRSQLHEIASHDEPEEELAGRLRLNWSADMERLSTSVGAHRDDLDFILDGVSLRPYGSQGEQRAAVLALFLAERYLTRENSSTQPLLLLDDVMSEFDPERRHLLMEELSSHDGVAGREPGQVIITAADAGLFTPEDLRGAHTVFISPGQLEPARE